MFNPFTIFKVDKCIGATKQDHFLSLIWIYFMLFPTGTVFNVTVPLFLLLLCDYKQKYNRVLFPLLILIIPTLLFNVGYDYMNFKAYSRLFEIAICFFTFACLRGRQILFPYIWFALIYIITSQICFLYNISIISTFFDQTYNITASLLETYQIDFDVIDSSSVGVDSRLGGMYINPNNCASYVTVLYALGLSEIRQLGSNKNLMYLFMGLVMYSFWVTGSRTSLICFGAITLYYLYTQGYSMTKYLIIFGAVAVAIIFSNVDTNNARMLDVESGMSNSFGIKMALFWHYLTHCDNPLYYVFGAGDLAASGLYHHFSGGTDCDFGNIFIVFGAIFWLLYWIMYYKMYKILIKEYRVILFTLLWVFSNSILISYRMCPVWFLCLGLLYRRSVIIKKTGNYIV